MGATALARLSLSIMEIMAWGRWRSVTVARRYISRWADADWEELEIPVPQLVPATQDGWRFVVGPAKVEHLWPASLVARDRRDEGAPTSGAVDDDNRLVKDVPTCLAKRINDSETNHKPREPMNLDQLEPGKEARLELVASDSRQESGEHRWRPDSLGSPKKPGAQPERRRQDSYDDSSAPLPRID